MRRNASHLIQTTYRHQVYTEGHKTHLANQLDPFLQAMARDLRSRLGGKDLTEYSRKRFERLLSSINADMNGASSDWRGHIREEIVDFAEYEAGFQARTLQQFVGVDFDVPARAQLRAAVLSSPLTEIRGIDGAKMLNGFFRGTFARQQEVIEGIIRAGYYKGETTTSIIRQVIGIQAAGYRDGQFAKLKRDVSTAVRTATQHAAMVARSETYKDNDDIIIGWQFVATLDDRTSIECQSLDGREFKLGEGPVPPIHHNCRSMTVPVLHPDFAALERGRSG